MKKIFFLFLVPFLFSCSDETAPQREVTENSKVENTNSNAENLPVYIVGVDPTHVPHVMRDERGLPTGFDVELLNAIGAKEGFRLEFIPTEWEPILDRLEDGSRDIVASGMSVTPERKARASLSNPVTNFYFTLLTDTNSPYRTIYDLDGKKIAVVQSAPIIGFLKQFLSGIDFEVIEYSTTFMGLRAVMNGEADAVFGHNMALAYYINTTPKSYYSGSFSAIPIPGMTQRPSVIAVKKGNIDLLNKINDGLAKLKADGSYDIIVNRWLDDIK